MNHAIITTVVCLVLLFVLFIWICLSEVAANANKDEKADTFKPVPPTDRVRLELMYTSFITGKKLYIPVKHVLHAQEMVDVLGLDKACVGYRRSCDGQSVVLYKLDGNHTLRRIKEVA